MVVARNHALVCAFVLSACGSDQVGASDTAGPDTLAPDTVLPDTTLSDTVLPDAEVVAPTCAEGAPSTWSSGPYGTRRGDRAADFGVTLTDGTTWSYAATYTGCDVVVIIPDQIAISSIDQISIWDDDAGLDDLFEQSPPDVVYLFVSNTPDAADAAAHATAMRQRLDAVLAAQDPRWASRVFVSAERAQDLDDWIGPALTTHLRMGIALDRDQRIHGVGSLADVGRRDQRLVDAGEWPWKQNIGNAAYDAVYLHAEALRQRTLDAEAVTLVTLWDGEVLSEKAERDVVLPDAATMATFDTLELEIVSRCPDPDALELGNCGAWDYLANFYLREPNGDGSFTDVELARAITSYHRETRWVIDASGLLPKLARGGTQTFLWSFAPSWNVQPTATTLRLRLSNRGGPRPVRVTPLFTGGPFNSAYNATRTPLEVPIAATTTKVAVWAIITGHGAGTSSCAEFCAHQHHVTVGATTYLREFPEASSEEGCVAETRAGMVPNQGGTWWFGRGGWCPGQAVAPWIIDVTSDVVPGATTTVSYRGTFIGQEPPDGAGDIVMSSYLVEYE